jgi:hypothetical protein
VEHIPFGERAAESKRNGQILMGHRNSEGCHFAAVAGPHTHSQPSPTRRRKRPGRRHPRASAARPDAQAPQSNDLPNLPGKIRSGQRPPPEPAVPVVAIARVKDSSPFPSRSFPTFFPIRFHEHRSIAVNSCVVRPIRVGGWRDHDAAGLA